MTDDFERDLSTALRSAVTAPPTEIDPSDITGDRHGRPRTRTIGLPLMTAFVVAAVIVTVFALTHVSGHRSPGAASPPHHDALTAAQRARAIHLAQAEARSAMPSGDGSTTPASSESGWPANVERVTAIRTTHAKAMQYVDAAGGDAAPVLVIRLVGDFQVVTTGPPGHTPATGTVMTLVADARTGAIDDFGLGHTPAALPNATVPYVR